MKVIGYSYCGYMTTYLNIRIYLRNDTIKITKRFEATYALQVIEVWGDKYYLYLGPSLGSYGAAKTICTMLFCRELGKWFL